MPCIRGLRSTTPRLFQSVQAASEERQIILRLRSKRAVSGCDEQVTGGMELESTTRTTRTGVVLKDMRGCKNINYEAWGVGYYKHIQAPKP